MYLQKNPQHTRTGSKCLFVQESLDVATEPWGVKVERVEVKDVRVPEQLQRAMAAEAEAAREARAKVIAAEGEHKASRSLRQAAEIIIESPAALQLRYLQTLNSISAENNRRGQDTGRQLILTLLQLLKCYVECECIAGVLSLRSSTIVFPVPIDIMSSFVQNQQNHTNPHPPLDLPQQLYKSGASPQQQQQPCAPPHPTCRPQLPHLHQLAVKVKFI